MSMGPLPYKARVVQAIPIASGDMNLTIEVFDASSTVRSTSYTIFPATSFQDSAAVRQLLDNMLGLCVQQFLIDAGDFTTAITSISEAVGG